MPTQSQIVGFAAAFTEALNGGEYVVDFTAERKYIVFLDRKDLPATAPLVNVAPVALSEEMAARSLSQELYVMGVSIQQAVDPTNVALIDNLMLLVDQMRDGMRFSTIDNCSWQKTDIPLLFEPDKIIDNGEFRCVIQFTFLTMRA